MWGLAVFAFVVTDLLAWVSHWFHHGVPTLWRFHAVHHAQQNLNALSDNRQHVGETVCAALIVFLPSHLLGLSADVAGTLTFVMIYYSAMLHSNIRTNFGPLQYVLMSPQSHRIHHSILPQHYNSNFATIFSCWDYLAGTRYHGNNEYPPTGIDDTGFPVERPSANPLTWVTAWWMQTLYPFQAMLKGRRGRPAPAIRESHAQVPPSSVVRLSPWLQQDAEATALRRLAALHRGTATGRALRGAIARSPGSVTGPVARMRSPHHADRPDGPPATARRAVAMTGSARSDP
jgi:hypothetical protein